MTEHEVSATCLDHVEQGLGITEHAAHGGDACFGDAALEGCERIGAGVDHQHVVAELTDPDSEPSGTATEVDDAEWPRTEWPTAARPPRRPTPPRYGSRCDDAPLLRLLRRPLCALPP